MPSAPQYLLNQTPDVLNRADLFYLNAVCLLIEKRHDARELTSEMEDILNGMPIPQIKKKLRHDYDEVKTLQPGSDGAITTAKRFAHYSVQLNEAYVKLRPPSKGALEFLNGIGKDIRGAR